MTTALDQAWQNRERDNIAEKNRALCCIGCSCFMSIAITLISINQTTLFIILSSTCFIICILFPIVYIVWYLDLSISKHHDVINESDELVINGIKIEAEQDFNKEYRYLIDGFIRINFINLTPNYNQRYYPKELIEIINNHINYGFDICPEQYKNILQCQGILINGNYDNPLIPSHSIITIGCLNGFRSDIGIFKIKCIHCSSNDSIGVISNINTCNDIFDLYFTDKDINPNIYYNAFYYKNGKGTLYGGSSKYLQTIHNKGYRNTKIVDWTSNTIITVTVNCINWTIQFDINHPNMEREINISMNLMANETYYPVISASVTNSKYLLLQKYILSSNDKE